MSTEKDTVRRRRNPSKEEGSTNSGEIEPGVEMREGMVPSLPEESPGQSPLKDLGPITPTGVDASLAVVQSAPKKKSLKVGQLIKRGFYSGITAIARSFHYIPYCSIIGLGLVMTLSMPEFLRGVLACVVASSLLGSSWRLLWEIITNAAPQRSAFVMPNFSKRSIIEIPTVEEHKSMRAYSGWMNEIHSYDPNNYHVSMTKSVYIKLEGTIMTVSNTTSRIPKRLLWNQKPIDLKTVQFTEHRTYDLLNCRVEMLPLGLADKRFFSRKYPIQLIIKKACLTKKLEAALSEAESDNFFDARGSESSQMSFTDEQARMSAADLTPRDFGSTIMNSDLQSLQKDEATDEDMALPSGDEIRLLLFSRGSREKEDWYRRFIAASEGDVHAHEVQLPNTSFLDDQRLQSTAERASSVIEAERPSSATTKTPNSEAAEVEANDDDGSCQFYEGLVIRSCATRSQNSYVRFMAMYQKACNQTTAPVSRSPLVPQSKQTKKSFRRIKKQEDDLWKGIDQSLFLGPSGSVVWFNVIVGRFVYSLLTEPSLQAKVHELLQKKINSIQLPSFMEDVFITQVNLGDQPPLIHRASQPMLDERGTWVDADVTYEGLVYLTVTTKLNLMRLKKQASRLDPNLQTNTAANTDNAAFTASPASHSNADAEEFERVPSTQSLQFQLDKRLSAGVIYDSDAESMGSSSSESEDLEVDGAAPSFLPSASAPGVPSVAAEAKDVDPTVAKSLPTVKKKQHNILKMVDRFAASNFFQYATELPYVQRAIENINSNITLRLEIRGIVGRVIVNFPPPPSNRMWIGFRGPPRIWIQAKPAFGEKSVDWSFVTSVIESKICEQINKIMVYPNMVDISINFLGPSPYQEQHK